MDLSVIRSVIRLVIGSGAALRPVLTPTVSPRLFDAPRRDVTRLTRM
ncbi:hypothetical protein [Rubrimonas cliftonensis]|nr:hypothetical protein [Rubrimonas cliftonensis]